MFVDNKGHLRFAYKSFANAIRVHQLSQRIPAVVGLGDEYVRTRVEEALRETGHYNVLPVEQMRDKLSEFQNGLLWLEYEDIPFENLGLLLDRVLVNSYCIRKGLIRKSQMAFVVNKHLSKHPDCILKRASPETYLFELDDPYYFEEAMSEVFEVAAELRDNALLDDPTKRKRWILKPSITNKGAEIFLFDTEDQLREMFEERYERFCQEDEDEDEDEDDGNENIEEVGGEGSEGESDADRERRKSQEEWKEEEEEEDSKDRGAEGADEKKVTTATTTPSGNLAHIREWVIQRYVANPLCLYGGRKFHIRTYVLAVGNIKVYVYREMLALFAASPYDPSDLQSRCHITNTCVQAEDPAFEESKVVRRFWSMDDALPLQTLECIFQDIKSITSEVFASVAHEVTVFQPLRNMFEIYGLDFLVDDDLGVHFLEANAFPDFGQTGSQLSSLIDALFRQAVVVAVEPFFGFETKGDDDAPDLYLVLDLRLRSVNPSGPSPC